MSWVFTAVNRRLRQAREFERKQGRRLNEAYARWHNKDHRELPHAVVGERRERDRRLLGTRERKRNDHREE
jgi:hypothetical protein